MGITSLAETPWAGTFRAPGWPLDILRLVGLKFPFQPFQTSNFDRNDRNDRLTWTKQMRGCQANTPVF